jgi:hypothetical protein
MSPGNIHYHPREAQIEGEKGRKVGSSCQDDWLGSQVIVPSCQSQQASSKLRIVSSWHSHGLLAWSVPKLPCCTLEKKPTPCVVVATQVLEYRCADLCTDVLQTRLDLALILQILTRVSLGPGTELGESRVEKRGARSSNGLSAHLSGPMVLLLTSILNLPCLLVVSKWIGSFYPNKKTTSTMPCILLLSMQLQCDFTISLSCNPGSSSLWFCQETPSLSPISTTFNLDSTWICQI